MTTWQRVCLFFSPVKSNYGAVIFLSIYSIIIALTSIYSIVFLEYIAKAVENSDIDAVVFRAIGFLGLSTTAYVLRLIGKPLHFRIHRDCHRYLETIYFKKYLESDNNDVEKVGTGRFISIMHKGFYVWVEEMITMFWDKLILLVGIVVSLVYIANASGLFLLLTVAIILVSIPRIGFFGAKALGYRKQSKEKLVEMDRMFVRRLMSKFEILQQSKFALETKKRKGIWDYWYRAKFLEKVRQGLGYDTITFLSKLLIVFIAFFVGKGVIEGTYNLSDFILLTGLGTLLARNLFQILQLIRKSMDNFIHIEKLWDTFENLGTISGYDEGEEFVYKKGEIKISDISYKYDKKPVFQNFSLEIAPGKKTAFVGLSGAGKSTLIKLLAGYLHVDKGTIIVDSQSLGEISLKSYYQNIGYLTQEPSVFDGTVKENLMYSLSAETKIEEIQGRVDDALKAAKCEFIYDLPKGIDTEIGERGIRLSGGQKQRLAIAKIFLKDPKIIILDEPTSALDSFSEEAITDAMHNLYEGRTVLIIAHRLQTVKEADEIVVLGYDETVQSSVVIEKGTHTQLVKRKGFYSNMLEVQTGF